MTLTIIITVCILLVIDYAFDLTFLKTKNASFYRTELPENFLLRYFISASGLGGDVIGCISQSLNLTHIYYYMD